MPEAMPALAASSRRRITLALRDALTQAYPTLKVALNPRTPDALASGDYVLVIKEQSDQLQGSSGNTEKRQSTIAIGVLCRAPDADANADALHAQVGQVLRRLMLGAKPALAGLPVKDLQERDVRFSVEHLDVDGALIVSNWEVTYLRQRDADLRS